MSYSSGWGLGYSQHTRPFAEKGWARKGLEKWDARWHGLSTEARRAFLDTVKGPTGARPGMPQPTVLRDRFKPAALDELVAAGFVSIEPSRKKSEPERVAGMPALCDFGARVRGVRRYHLLDPAQHGALAQYLANCYYSGEVYQAFANVLRLSDLSPETPDSLIKRWILRRHWPGWALKAIKAPLKDRLFKVLKEADGPIILADLPARLPDAKPADLREALDELIAYMVAFEDLDPKTLDLVVGLLPAVRADLADAGKPKVQPPLVVVEQPAEIAPEGSMIVNDLRGFLLEVASDPPRLKQDHELYAKEVQRFAELLEPIPSWFPEPLQWTDEERLDEADAWAHELKLVKVTKEGKEVRLQISPKGQEWLGRGLSEQYASIYESYNKLPSARGSTRARFADFDDDFLEDAYYRSYRGGFTGDYESGDSDFLGSNLKVMRKQGQKGNALYWQPKADDYTLFRDAFYRVFEALPMGVFHRADSVVYHAAFPANTPLHMGLAADKVVVRWEGILVPAFDEEREHISRLAIDAFLAERLVPLGAVRVALDKENNLCIARTPRLDAYFARPGAKIEFPEAATGAAKVVVQPDFSIVVIGIDPAPAAALIPFCERSTRGTSQGAIVLKLTKTAVVKAVSHGMKPADILDRLQKHATNEVPANVLREVEGWTRWVRSVHTEPLTVVRCADRDTADRVSAALGKHAERLNDTLVAIPGARLTPAERLKLQGEGVIVAGAPSVSAAKGKTKKTKARY